MRDSWWKIIAVLLILGGTFMALYTPLRPGVIHVDPERLAPGDQEVTITSYGTAHTKAESTHAHLDNDGQIIAAKSTKVIDDQTLLARFIVPGELSNELSDIVVRTDLDGTMWLPDAFWMDATGQGLAVSQTDKEPERIKKEGFFFPLRNILYETIRNLNFHVPMWFSMISLFLMSTIHSVKNLSSNHLDQDRKALEFVNVGIVFGILGTITGSIWAKFTWGAWWVNDVKLNGSAITMLIYFAYLVLRGSVEDEQKKARIAAVYNIFAFILLIVFIGILPRMYDSLHPGNGGNPGFNNYDLDNNMKMVFYPAVLAWILLGWWITSLRIRLASIQQNLAS